MRKKDLSFYTLIFLLLTACGPSDKPVLIENTPSNELSPPETSYPISTDNKSASAYPSPINTAEGNSAYPAPPPAPNENKRFTFEEPVKADDIRVSGTGPPNTPIKIISISQAGELLGLGSVSDTGIFSISLSRQLEKQEFIGIQLGDESLLPNFLDAPGTDIPMIGFVLDQSLVQP